MEDEIDVLKVIEALCNMGYRVVSQDDDLFSLDYPQNPSDPYNIVIDASRGKIPRDDLYDQLDLVGVDIDVFSQHFDALG